MKNELYKSKQTLDIDIGDMTVSVFAMTLFQEKAYDDYSDSHFHTAHEFQYAASGSFVLADENVNHKINEGEFAIIPPGTFHSNVTEQEFTRCTFRFSITSNGKDENEFSEYCFYKKILESVKGITVLKQDKICRDVKRLMQEDTSKIESRHRMQIYAALLITDILQHIASVQAPSEKRTESVESENLSAEDERIKFIIETCISTYFSTDEASDRIASALGMSKRNSARVVNRLLGENISEIVTKQRMHMARTMITKTDRQLCDIAESVGYKTYVAFFTAFKKYYGISPASLRE